MINIAVCCRGSRRKSTVSQFEEFLASLGFYSKMVFAKHNTAYYNQPQFTRVTTSLDIRGRTFDGVIRLSELAPEVEQELIACMRPAIPL